MYLFRFIMCSANVYRVFYCVLQSDMELFNFISVLCFVFVPGTEDNEVHLLVGLRYM